MKINMLSILNVALALAIAPLMLGVINRVKAKFAGRCGRPLLQAYYDIFKLLRKGAVYSTSTTWVFRAGPMISLAAMIASLLLIPFAGQPAIASFSGDLILLAYFLALGRFLTILAALDTASAFEGMGSSREAAFSALAEPALLLALAAVARYSGSISLSEMYWTMDFRALIEPGGVSLLLAAAAMVIVFLAENSRIPFDDPNTHLELTMIHEVMVLDHGGVDLVYITYGAALKMWLIGALLTGIILPFRTGFAILDSFAGVGAMLLLAAFVGVIESIIARLRLTKVPQLLSAASVLAILAIIVVSRKIS